MKVRKYLTPDYVFELSWEVCNKVGGIHTVLASLAPTLGKHFGDKVVYIGPDLNTPEFLEDKSLKKDWAAALKAAGMRVRIGHWDVVSSPLAIVVDVNQCLDIKNEVYSRMWDKYKVDSLHAYGDYDEASMWAYASGRVVETIVQKCLKKDASVVLQAHEWLSAMGLLHVKGTCPSVATVFTTHATSIGRSICGNGKSLYKYLQQYDGDVMARELNMQSKHSSEKAAALLADCFTTVSSITDKECRALLGKGCDVILPNGFDTKLVPEANAYKNMRAKSRRKILKVISALTGKQLPSNTLIISTSGRNDYRPKGFDVYMEALKRLNASPELSGDVVALIEVPCWMESPREDLLMRLSLNDDSCSEPLDNPYITHNLHNFDYNRIVSTNPGGGFAGILNRYDLVDVVRGLGLTVGVFFSLSGADDGHENLISLIRYKTGMVFIALLLDQFDFYAAGSKCVRGTVRVGEVRERCARDGDGDQRHAQENCCDFLLHDVLLLINIVFSAPARRELLRHWRQPMRQQHQPCRPSGQRRP